MTQETDLLFARDTAQLDEQLEGREDVSRDDGFWQDVIRGLAQTPKVLSSMYFYDERGSQLFDQICELDEYYLTRTELMIMKEHAAEIAASLGDDILLIEYGSGSSLKTRILLDHAHVAAYLPVDISADHLGKSAADLQSEYPALRIEPVTADFTKTFSLPELDTPKDQRVIYFPGSTLGNFAPPAARRLLANMSQVAGDRGQLLIGIDLKKDSSILDAAYNDRQGVTAEFNLNVLRRVNEELGADFDLDQFEHRAVYNEAEGRVEMHLVSLVQQEVHVGSESFSFLAGESICTEYSHKYDLVQFHDMACEAGWETLQTWVDEDRYFAVVHARRI